MPRTPIPAGITRDDILQAIADLKAGAVVHEFHESERFDLIHEEERLAPKAVLGVSARRVAGRLLVPADFSGGEGSKCFRILRSLGFTVERKPEAENSAALKFEVGREYNRQAELHRPFAGQERGGIATPSNFAAIFLFTGIGGESFGYEDKFREDGVFLYTGEGQRGDMKLLRGNLAIQKSGTTGRQLFLFEQTRKGFVRFVGKANYLGHHSTERPDADGAIRKAIVFELEVGADSLPASSSKQNASEPQLPKPKSLAELRAAASLTLPNNSTSEQRMVAVHHRSEAVKQYVLRRAAGKCEGCETDAPFLNRKKQPYLEPHHTTRRSDGGPDHPQHVVALCPNCHRRVHSGLDGDEYNRSLMVRLRVIEAPVDQTYEKI